MTNPKNLNIGQLSSDTLAVNVIAYKCFGLDKELSILCMKELLRRQKLGEDFNFEEFIYNEVKAMAKPNMNVDVSKIVKGIIK